MLKYFTILLVSASFLSTQLNAQSFGFGCLGLGGINGGYSITKYNAEGLNDYLVRQGYFDSPGVEDKFFKEGKGFRIGANIFNVHISKSVLTLKALYQFSREDVTLNREFNRLKSISNFELKMDYWAVGIDFRVPITSFIDWKVFDGGITFFKTRLKDEIVYQNQSKEEIIYELPKVNLGYYAGAGFVIVIVPGYFSIEATGIYNQISIENLQNKSSNAFIPENSDKNFVESGGFTGVVQINLGLPL